MGKATGLLIAFLLAAAPADQKLIESGGNNHAHKFQSVENAQGHAITPVAKAAKGETQNVDEKAPHGEKDAGWFGIPFDGWVAIFTGLLVGVTAGLWVATWRLWKVTKRSVVNAEKALTDLERPHVFVEVTRNGISYTDPHGQLAFSLSILEINCFNVGRSPAFPTHIEWKVEPIQQGTGPIPIDSTMTRGRHLPEGIVISSERTFTEREKLFLRFDQETQDALLNRSQSLWCHGFLRYSDTFGKHYITGFARVYDPIGAKFVARGDEDKNYVREEKVNDIPAG